MVKVGDLVPVTVIKAMPELTSYLTAIAGTDLMALLPRNHAGMRLRVGDNTVAAVHSASGTRIFLSQINAFFYRRLTEMLINPLINEEKVRVVRAASVSGAGFAKVVVASLDGCNPIDECLPYILGSKQYTNTVISLIKFSEVRDEYVKNSFAPAPARDVQEVIHYGDGNLIYVHVSPDKLGLFIGKAGANVATVSKLLGVEVRVRVSAPI